MESETNVTKHRDSFHQCKPITVRFHLCLIFSALYLKKCPQLSRNSLNTLKNVRALKTRCERCTVAIIQLPKIYLSFRNPSARVACYLEEQLNRTLFNMEWRFIWSLLWKYKLKYGKENKCKSDLSSSEQVQEIIEAIKVSKTIIFSSLYSL